MRKKLWYLFIFALAMGYLESAVVVYLRQLFYPDGFTFPIKQIGTDHAFVELGREAATVLMLLAVAFIAERTKRGRLTYVGHPVPDSGYLDRSGARARTGLGAYDRDWADLLCPQGSSGGRGHIKSRVGLHNTRGGDHLHVFCSESRRSIPG